MCLFAVTCLLIDHFQEIKFCRELVNKFIIPPFHHFTILGCENAQNIARYYTVELSKKYGRKVEQQNGRTE